MYEFSEKLVKNSFVTEAEWKASESFGFHDSAFNKLYAGCILNRNN
jgi:hypothetical protein